MKICFFSLSSGWGGAENVVYNLTKYMGKSKHDIHLIINDEIHHLYHDIQNVSIHTIGPIVDYKKFLKKNFGISIPTSLINNRLFSKIIKFLFGPIIKDLNFIKTKENILTLLNEIKPDILHIHNPMTLDFYCHIQKDIKFRSVYTAHGKDFEKRTIPFDAMKDLRKVSLVASFDQITSVSKYGQEYVNSNGIHSDIKIIPNGIEYFENEKIKVDPKFNKESFTLMFPGGDKKNKGGLILIEAMKIINKKKLPIHLYYSGIITEEFLAENQIENVSFLGLLPQNKYLTKLSKCDGLVLLSETEQFPIAILEAMGLGKAIITTNAGGISEFCYDKRNGVYTKRNPKDVAQRIIDLFNDVKLREKIFQNNIQDAGKYDWKNIVKQYISMYEQNAGV